MSVAVNQAANRRGVIADFVTGYLAKATIFHQVEVMGGVDSHYGVTTPAAAAALTTGFAVGRLVVLTRNADGSCTIAEPNNNPSTTIVTALGNANAIIAQSDDSLRNVPSDIIPTERYTSRNRNILFNTAVGTAPTAATGTMKSIAVYEIVNPNDIKIIPVAPATNSVRR